MLVVPNGTPDRSATSGPAAIAKVRAGVAALDPTVWRSLAADALAASRLAALEARVGW
jgi:hypothetical protein